MTTTPARKQAAQALRNFPRTLAQLLARPDYRQFGDSSDDWIHDPDRMERCHIAAEHGEDGSTHAEAIEDMRDNLSTLRRDTRHQYSERTEEILNRIVEAIGAEIDACELWHEQAGSLHQLTGGGDPEQYRDRKEATA